MIIRASLLLSYIAHAVPQMMPLLQLAESITPREEHQKYSILIVKP